LAWLAFQVDLVAFSRLAIPEVPAMAVELAAYLVLVTGPVSRRRLSAAGVLACAAITMKATTLPTLAVLAFVALLRGRDSTLGPGHALLAFIAAPAACAVALTTSAAFRGLGALPSSAGVAFDFVDVWPWARIPWNVRRDALMTIYPAVWVGLLGWCTRDRDGDPHLRCLYTTSALWLAADVLQGAAFIYYPDRYVLHAHAPAAVNIAAGVTMLRPSRLMAIALPARTACLLLLIALVLPDVRTRYQVAIGLVLVVLSVIASRRTASRGADGPSRPGSPETIWLRSSFATAVVIAAAAFAVHGSASNLRASRYSIRDASLELERLVDAGTLVGTSGGESLFTANRLRYRSILAGIWDSCPPPVIVITGRFHDPDGRLGSEYELLRTFDLFVSPAYFEQPYFRRYPEALGQDLNTVRVYRRLAGARVTTDERCRIRLPETS
jgi:hypothetical protein